MHPDIMKAAQKAVETFIKYDLVTPDPAAVLRSFRNVLLIPFEDEFIFIDKTCEHILSTRQDALTMSSRKNGKLRYIVIYNQNNEPYKRRFALARELGHIVLEHDGNTPEEVREEEALCFAYHFLCPFPEKNKKINYRPQRISLSLEFKEALTFNSVESLKLFIAEEENRKKRFIGKNKQCSPDDIELSDPVAYDRITGWKNCFNVTLNGVTLGYCGE